LTIFSATIKNIIGLYTIKKIVVPLEQHVAWWLYEDMIFVPFVFSFYRPEFTQYS